MANSGAKIASVAKPSGAASGTATTRANEPLVTTELAALKEEFAELWGTGAADKIKAEDRSSYQTTAAAPDAHAAALCLSGGGIRSATFALGVLQALAQAKLL